MSEPKIKGGYYIKARCIKNSSIYKAPPYVREIWDYLLREANHGDQKYNGFIVKRGQLFKSYKDIREDLCWYIGYRKEKYNENQMKKGMRYLVKELMITTMKEPRGVLITVCNYDYFQNPKNYERTNERTNEGTNEEPMKNHTGLSINKNDKETKEEKKEPFLSDSIEYRLANYLLKFIIQRNPGHKKPDLQKWAKDIDLMIRLDKRDPDKIKQVIKWSQLDTPDKQPEGTWKGWAINILSIKKLRAKFDTLVLKIPKNEKSNSTQILTKEDIDKLNE